MTKSCIACGEELVHGRIPAGAYKRRQKAHGRSLWDYVIKRDPCAYCGARTGLTVDHIEPKALGGSKGGWPNRTGACYDCNQAKSDTPMLLFLLERLEELAITADDQ